MKLNAGRPLRALVRVCFLGLASIIWSVTSSHAQSVASGGFVESDDATTARPMLSSGQSGGFLPARGTFTFPAPYNTQGIRITNGSDCGGADCVRPAGYSYWRNINN